MMQVSQGTLCTRGEPLEARRRLGVRGESMSLVVSLQKSNSQATRL
uniref:Uncharacterized protein n=1 Tax=Rhizophora mucronata TaxID=61149 RepID=A0A2P2NZQ4_RHIMU